MSKLTHLGIFMPSFTAVGGGAETFNRRLASHVVQRGIRVTLLTTQAISEWRAVKGRIVSQEGGVRMVSLPVWQKNPQMVSAILRAELRIVMPIYWRGVQAALMNKILPDTLFAARIAQRRGIKTVGRGWASGPVGDVATFPAHVRPDYAALNWINALTADLKRELAEWGYPPDRIGIIPNGVDTDMFAPPAAPPPGLRVAYTGQFRPEKRIDVILQAWKLIQAEFPTARLSLIGGEDRMAEYQRMAADLGVQPDFVGSLPAPQVRDKLQTAHIFIMSGMSEGMSNALLEGMAVGLAPITTDTPGNRALIAPGENGLVYEGTSPDALAAGLRRLLTDSELRARLGAAARQTVVQQYSLQSVVDRYLALFERLIAEK